MPKTSWNGVDGDGEDLQHDHPQDGGPELAVGEQVPREDRAVLRAGVEDVEDLEQHEGGEGQREGVGLGAVVHRPGQDAEGAERHHRAVADQDPEAAAVQDAVIGTRGARLIVSRAGGSTPRAMAGGPSMIRLTHRTWSAVKGTGRPSSWRADQGADGAEVRRELEPDELDDVVVDGPAPLDGGDDRGEVVVGEDHGGGLLAHLRAGDAHGHADVGAS